MHLGHVALRDRKEARQTRLRRQKVVVRRIETTRSLGIGEAVANREQPSFGFVQELEVHAVEERFCARRQPLESIAGAANIQRITVVQAFRSAFRQLPQPNRERQQRTRKVSAVDRGDIAGRERFERAGVVPVQEVTVEAFEPFNSRQGRPDPVDQRPRVDEAQVVSRERRQKAQTDVGRRRSVCHPQLGNDLHIVGRKTMVFGADEPVEVLPRLESDAAQVLAISGPQLGTPPRHRPAQGERNQRCNRPQRQHRQRDRERAWTLGRNENQRANGQQGTRGHAGEERT